MRFIAAVLLLSLAATSALAEKLITVESKFSVRETLDRLTVALEQRGIKPAARIDHAAGAKSVGMELPPAEVLMFGNGSRGEWAVAVTSLYRARPIRLAL